MNFLKTKGVFLSIILIFIISVLANIYSFNKLTKIDTNNKIVVANDSLLEDKEIVIKQLESIVSSLESELAVSQKSNDDLINQVDKEPSKITGNKELTLEENEKNKDLLNASKRFIEYAYNVTPENYTMLKQNADKYMTENLASTLFASDGIDEAAMNIQTVVKDIKVYVESDETKEAVVHYTFDLEFLNNGYKETNDSYVLLKFKEVGGTIKVSEIKAINNIGGI